MSGLAPHCVCKHHAPATKPTAVGPSHGIAQDPRSEVDPDCVVALGAAVQAAALGGQIARREAILFDETPDCQDFVALMEAMQARVKGG